MLFFNLNLRHYIVDDVTSAAAVSGGDKTKLDLDLVTAMVMKQWERMAEETSRAIQGGAVQVDPGFAQLTPRLLSTLETIM